MEKPISPKQKSMAGLRPSRSPSGPISSPPSGRVAKPTPKVARVSSSALVSSLPGKNTLPIWTAKKLKVRKS